MKMSLIYRLDEAIAREVAEDLSGLLVELRRELVMCQLGHDLLQARERATNNTLHELVDAMLAMRPRTVPTRSRSEMRETVREVAEKVVDAMRGEARERGGPIPGDIQVATSTDFAPPKAREAREERRARWPDTQVIFGKPSYLLFGVICARVQGAKKYVLLGRSRDAGDWWSTSDGTEVHATDSIVSFRVPSAQEAKAFQAAAREREAAASEKSAPKAGPAGDAPSRKASADDGESLGTDGETWFPGKPRPLLVGTLVFRTTGPGRDHMHVVRRQSTNGRWYTADARAIKTRAVLRWRRADIKEIIAYEHDHATYRNKR